jgi:hypothetical protein
VQEITTVNVTLPDGKPVNVVVLCTELAVPTADVVCRFAVYRRTFFPIPEVLHQSDPQPGAVT